MIIVTSRLPPKKGNQFHLSSIITASLLKIEKCFKKKPRSWAGKLETNGSVFKI